MGIIDNAERIGMIGSPSSTIELSLDIIEAASKKKLVGELVIFEFNQDGKKHYALGQITEVLLKNIWLEDPTMRSLARRRGKVNPVSEQQDTHLGQMTISAVFAEENDGFVPSILGTVPPTGTFINLVNDKMLETLLEKYKQEIFYLGYVYGSTPKLPLWFKHFSTGNNGAGDAYHIGIFGKTGSGKSVLAKMIMLAYARYSNMGIFVLDPQGEFSIGLRNQFNNMNMSDVLNGQILEKLGKKYFVYDLTTLKLDRWEIFGELLKEYDFFFELGVKTSQYQDVLSDEIIAFFRKNKNIKIENLNEDIFWEALGYINTVIERIYAGKAGIERVRNIIEETQRNPASNNLLEKWNNVIQFFQGENKETPEQIVGKSMNADRPLVVIDLSTKPMGVKQDVWDRKIKPLLIDRFLDAITRRAEMVYHNSNSRESINCLVLIDEAHRLAPREKQMDERLEKVKNRLVDAARTTRKYGLGWMFISQTLSSLHKEIISQIRIFFFGFGLALGSEFQALREIIGGDQNSLKLYQSFRDPHSSFDVASRQYSFMTVGPVSPLSFAGTPLFFTAFNNVQEFLEVNGIKEGE